MFTNIALVAHPGAELQKVRHLLRNPVRYTVREFLSIDDLNHGLKNFPFDMLIMRLPSFEAGHVNIVLKARQRFAGAGIVTIASEIHPSARYQVKDVLRHKLLLEPMEIADLPSVIEKITRGDGSSARLHPRVHRKGECELVDPDKGERIKCKFVDFAQMGARLLLGPHAPLRKHTRYQLHYRSTTEPNRIHRIESSVVWTEIASGMMGTIMNGPQQLVGVRFIAAL